MLIVERAMNLPDVTEVLVGDSRKAMAHAAAKYYDNPSSSFNLIGITGTNGKTTTSYLIESIVRQAGRLCGVVGDCWRPHG